jgi:hypothetical protein
MRHLPREQPQHSTAARPAKGRPTPLIEDGWHLPYLPRPRAEHHTPSQVVSAGGARMAGSGSSLVPPLVPYGKVTERRPWPFREQDGTATLAAVITSRTGGTSPSSCPGHRPARPAGPRVASSPGS